MKLIYTLIEPKIGTAILSLRYKFFGKFIIWNRKDYKLSTIGFTYKLYKYCPYPSVSLITIIRTVEEVLNNFRNKFRNKFQIFF